MSDKPIREEQTTPQQQHASESTPDQGSTALVLAYLQSRMNGVEEELQSLRQVNRALTVDNEALQSTVQSLQQSLGSLKEYCRQLQEAYREMEVGFRRHRSDHVPPSELQLALTLARRATDPGQTSDEATSAVVLQEPEGTPLVPPPAGQTEPPAQGEPPAEKKRHKHGRRKTSPVPSIIFEVLPPEVMLEGLSQFEKIGADDTRLFGFRRGGPIELVFRRFEFVRKNAAGTTADSSQRCADSVTDEPEAPVTDVQETQVRIQDDAIVVLEADVLSVPQDPGFKRSPFIDGVIVRYFPELRGEGDGASAVLVAPPIEVPIERAMADASLIARILVRKWDDHMPHYRQERDFERYGFPLPRANMCRWQWEVGQWAVSLVGAMWKEALSRSWIGMDAASTAVFDRPKYRKGHVFVLVAPGDYVLYRYSDTYDGDVVVDLFGGYTGVIVADASANHNRVFGPGQATEAGCWSHSRRYVVKAFRAGEKALAARALQYINALFRIERRIALLSPELRLEIRQAESAPIVEQLYKWVDHHAGLVSDASLMHAAFTYLVNQKGALTEFLRNGEIPIHNNLSEGALRRHVKGRRAWLFHGSNEHAERACAIGSLIASCEVHGLDAELYLQEVMTVAPSWPASRILELSPKYWVQTRQRLISQGRLKYIDLAHVSGSRLAFRR